MSEPKKRKGTKKYLADFRLGEDGKYSYQGTYYRSSEESVGFPRHLAIDTVCVLVVFACWLFCGLLPKAAMSDSIYVVLPWLLVALGLILCVPSPVRRWGAKGVLRTYLYKRYIKSLFGKSLFLLFSCISATIAQLLYTMLSGVSGRIGPACWFLLASVLSSLSSLILVLSVRKERTVWQEESLHID